MHFDVGTFFPLPLIILFSLSLDYINPLQAFCQEAKISEEILTIAEELAGNETNPEDAILYVEKLQELLDDPVKINFADEEELSRLFFLSGFQVKALADYVATFGKIISMYEIPNIPGFDREIALLISPFISLEHLINPGTDSITLHYSSLTNLVVKPVESDIFSAGSPLKILTRQKFTSGSFSAGFTAEKDQGEKFFHGELQKPEFLSAYFTYSGTGIIKKFIIGDYSARMGLGTNINTGISTGISLTSSGYLACRNEIKSYTSTDENNFFRGFAIRLGLLKETGFSFFFSGNNLDATLKSSDSLSYDHFETLYRTGLHDTPSSLIKKDVIKETSYGANLTHDFRNFRAGIIYSESILSLPAVNLSALPREIYDFKGSVNRLLTATYSTMGKRMILSGEITFNMNGKTAFVQGLSFRPDDRLNINILYRRYEPGFTAFHGKAPFSTSSGGNLTGILGNFTFETTRFLFISAGFDFRCYPWLKYRCNAPSNSKAGEIRIKYLPSEKITAEGSYSYRSSMLDDQGSTGIVKQTEHESRNIRATLKYSPDENLTLATRIEYRIVMPSGNIGMLLYEDISYMFRTVPLLFRFRYTAFSTESWDSRIYAYENDLLYGFSIPALSGSGNRCYIMAKLKICKRAELRFKYGFTTITLKRGEIQENDELKIQINVRL